MALIPSSFKNAVCIRSESPRACMHTSRLNAATGSGMFSTTESRACTASWYWPILMKLKPMFRKILNFMNLEVVGI